MRIKLDEHIPGTLCGYLAALGHDVRTVVDQGLTGHRDHVIWQTVSDEKRFLITQDLGFGQLATASAMHSGLLVLRLRLPSASALMERVRALFVLEDVGRWHDRVVIVTDTKVRVRSSRHNGA